MATLDEIKVAVDIFKKENCPYELMHCNSSYPMKEADANLRCIETLKNKFNCDVGYSGHEVSLLNVSLPAVTLGATSIERHITLDRSLYGSDQSSSLEVHILKKFVDSVRSVSKILGDGNKRVTTEEELMKKKLRVYS